MKEINDIKFTEAGLAAFEKFYDGFVKPSVDIVALEVDIMNLFIEIYETVSTLRYPLKPQYSLTGRPYVFVLEKTGVEFFKIQVPYESFNPGE